MRHMVFLHKDINVRVHTPLVVTRLNDKEKHELVYASVIDIDSRVQAVFAQFHHSRKASDVFFRLRHAPRIGETEYDQSQMYVVPKGKYKHQSQREDDTFVTGLVASERLLSRQDDGYIIFAWDGQIHEKFFWAIESFYETPLLLEWVPYLFSQLVRDQHLIELAVHDFTGDYSTLVAYELLANEDVLDEYISAGLRFGAIQMNDDVISEEVI